MAERPAAARPNVLFLMSDEHRPDVAGYAGDPVVRTPVLDELARTGVVFRNAYTPSPICIPARQALMAGQLPRTCGCEVFGEDLPPGHMTFARRFAQYAYATVACGKLHHTGPDQMQGWTQRLCGDIAVGSRSIPERREEEFARHDRPTAAVKWSDAKEIWRAGVGRGPQVVKDEYAVRGALDFIEEYFASPFYDRESNHRPLLLKVSLNQPHYPYTAGAERFGYYLNRVRPFLDQPVSPHPSSAGGRSARASTSPSARSGAPPPPTTAWWRRSTGSTGGCSTPCATSGEDPDDWLVVYTSDHGEMLGEHGIWEKQKFYEASARVPLIVRWPRRFAGGRVVRENVNLCDLFATLCDLAGIETPPGLDSRSLVPLLRGEGDGWDDETVSQFGRRNLLIKRGALKYQYYGPEMPEVLFDLARDPGETTDFIADPAYRPALAAFRERRAALGFGPDADPAYVNAGYGSP